MRSLIALGILLTASLCLHAQTITVMPAPASSAFHYADHSSSVIRVIYRNQSSNPIELPNSVFGPSFNVKVTDLSTGKIPGAASSDFVAAIARKSDDVLGSAALKLLPGQIAFVDLDLGRLYPLKPGSEYGVTVQYASGALKGKTATLSPVPIPR